MACCALGAFLVTQWVLVFRAFRRAAAGWCGHLLMIAGLLVFAQTAAFAWDLAQHRLTPAADGHDAGPVAGDQAAPLCGETTQETGSAR